MTLKHSRQALIWETVELYNCSRKRRPPATKHMPKINNKLDRIEPRAAA